jgi:hypothetical protein
MSPAIIIEYFLLLRLDYGGFSGRLMVPTLYLLPCIAVWALGGLLHSTRWPRNPYISAVDELSDRLSSESRHFLMVGGGLKIPSLF